MDIYFSPEYARLYEAHENAKAEAFVHESGFGRVAHVFLRRPVPYGLIPGEWYDIATPYGYGGPAIERCEPGREEELIASYAAAWEAYCADTRIVSEFIRFHPLIQNQRQFCGLYRLEGKRTTVGIDLRGDFYMDEYTVRCRRHLKKAERLGVAIEFDMTGADAGADAEAFYHVYTETMKKLSASGYYYFGAGYIEQIFKSFPHQCFFVHARHKGDIVASSLFLAGGEYLHYHLSGTLPEFLGLCANNAIMHAAAQWGKREGRTVLHLGGGASAAPDDSLLTFKKSFSKNGLFEFYRGYRIADVVAYQRLTDAVRHLAGFDEEYFPAYRSVSV